MASTYPGTIDSFTNPSGTSTLASAGHANLHGEERDAIENIEAVLGTTAGTSVLKDVLAGQFVSTKTGTETLTNKTLTKPVINAFYDTPQTYSGTAGGTTTFNLSLSNDHRLTMPNSAGSVTLAVSNAVNGQKFIVSVTQGTAGSGTVGWFSGITWAGGAGTTATTTASKTDIWGFVATGTATFRGVTIGTAF